MDMSMQMQQEPEKGRRSVVVCPTCKTELTTQAPGRLLRDLEATVSRAVNGLAALKSACSAEETHVRNALFAHWRDDHDGKGADCAVCGMYEHRLNRLTAALSAAQEEL